MVWTCEEKGGGRCVAVSDAAGGGREETKGKTTKEMEDMCGGGYEGVGNSGGGCTGQGALERTYRVSNPVMGKADKINR